MAYYPWLYRRLRGMGVPHQAAVDMADPETQYDEGGGGGLDETAVQALIDDSLTSVNTEIDTKADDSAVVKLTGAQTVAGVKTFSSNPVIPDGALSIAKTTGLQTALDGKTATGHAHATSDITSGTLDIARVVVNGLVIVDKTKNGGSWPGARPTARTDITVRWIGDTDPGSLAINGDEWVDL